MIETALIGFNAILILTAVLAIADLTRFAARQHRRAHLKTMTQKQG